jgi:hypothetical protein
LLRIIEKTGLLTALIVQFAVRLALHFRQSGSIYVLPVSFKLKFTLIDCRLRLRQPLVANLSDT